MNMKNFKYSFIFSSFLVLLNESSKALQTFHVKKQKYSTSVNKHWILEEMVQFNRHPPTWPLKKCQSYTITFLPSNELDIENKTDLKHLVLNDLHLSSSISCLFPLSTKQHLTVHISSFFLPQGLVNPNLLATNSYKETAFILCVMKYPSCQRHS